MLLMLAMLATLLAGCGGETKDTNSNTGADAQGEADTQQSGEDEEPYEIVIELMVPATAQPDTAMVEEAINAITVPAINCTVKFREITIADHATQLSLLGTDGDKMDIVFVGYTTSMNDLVSNGLLVGLGDLLEEYASEMLEKAGVLMEACKVGDDYYCVPGNYYPAVHTSLTYVTEALEQYQVQIPENPSNTLEYKDAFFDAIKESEFTGYPTTAGDGASVNLTGVNAEKFGASMGTDGIYGVLMDLSSDTEIVNIYETPEYLAECLKRREWNQNGSMVPDSLTSGETFVDGVMAGKVFGSISDTNSTFTLNTKNIVGKEMSEISIGEMYVTGTSIPEYGLGVTVTSERPDKCVQLLNMIMTNAELANLMNYGIEGTHYNKVSEHIIELPEGVDFSNMGYGAQIVSFGDSSEIYHKAPFTEEWYDTVDQYSAENAVVSQAFGYVFDSSSVRTQVAAVSSVVQEYNPGLMCGVQEDVEGRVQEFISALKKAGIEDIIAENQRQFDEWRASKE